MYPANAPRTWQRDWWEDFAFLWMSPVCLGQFFLSSRTGLRSLSTSYCLSTGPVFPQSWFNLGLAIHLDMLSFLPWCKTGSDGLQCEWGWLCSLRTKHLEQHAGSSSWTPLACMCCLQKRPQLEGMHQREKICMARKAVGYSIGQLGSVSAVGPTADWCLLVVFGPSWSWCLWV